MARSPAPGSAAMKVGPCPAATVFTWKVVESMSATRPVFGLVAQTNRSVATGASKAFSTSVSGGARSHRGCSPRPPRADPTAGSRSAGARRLRCRDLCLGSRRRRFARGAAAAPSEDPNQGAASFGKSLHRASKRAAPSAPQVNVERTAIYEPTRRLARNRKGIAPDRPLARCHAFSSLARRGDPHDIGVVLRALATWHTRDTGLQLGAANDFGSELGRSVGKSASRTSAGTVRVFDERSSAARCTVSSCPPAPPARAAREAALWRFRPAPGPSPPWAGRAAAPRDPAWRLRLAGPASRRR